MTDEWIVVPNWDRFQHYSDRDPLWIKVYTALLHNDDWLSLTDAEKGFLLTIWLEFASAHGVLKASRVPSRLRPVNAAKTLERLSNAGFIQLSASKPLALVRSREVEKKERREDARAREAKQEASHDALTEAEQAARAEAMAEPSDVPRDPAALAKINELTDQLAGRLSPP